MNEWHFEFLTLLGNESELILYFKAQDISNHLYMSQILS